MNLLAILPRVADLPALDGLEELGRIARQPGVSVLPLAGAVSRQDVATTLRSRHWDVVLWIGHGGPGMLLLSDGDAIRPTWLAAMMRGQVDLAVLSVCESDARPVSQAGLVASFADTLPAAGVSLVAMAFEVADRAAMGFDVALVQALAAGSSPAAAHQAALGTISDTEVVRAPQFHQGVLMPDYTPLNQANETQRLVYDLMTRMGVVETKMGAVAEDVSEMRGDLREMRSDLRAFSPTRQPVSLPRELVILLTSGALALLLLLMVIAWRLV